MEADLSVLSTFQTEMAGLPHHPAAAESSTSGEPVEIVAAPRIIAPMKANSAGDEDWGRLPN